MSKKNYQTLNYYECPVCNYTWTELYDEEVPDMCPCCDKEDVEPTKTFENVLNWTDHYTIIQNHIHPAEDYQFETYGEDYKYVKTHDQNYVWTVVDNDFGGLSIVKGLHHVNRQYFILSKESHANDNENYCW